MGDDTVGYQASVSGYGYEGDDYPRLDSINLSLRLQKVTDKEIITIEKIVPQKANKWHISPSIGVGYGLINKKPDIWVGVSANYNF